MAKLTFLDLNGEKRTIPELPLTDRPHFKAAREKVLTLLSSYPPETELDRLCDPCDGGTELQEAIDLALGYFQIDPQWLTIGMMGDLLLSFESSAGVLWQIEFTYQ